MCSTRFSLPILFVLVFFSWFRWLRVSLGHKSHAKCAVANKFLNFRSRSCFHGPATMQKEMEKSHAKRSNAHKHTHTHQNILSTNKNRLTFYRGITCLCWPWPYIAASLVVIMRLLKRKHWRQQQQQQQCSLKRFFAIFYYQFVLRRWRWLWQSWFFSTHIFMHKLINSG